MFIAPDVLRAEITARVPEAVRLGRDTQAITDALSPGCTVHVLVPIADLQAYLQTTGAWWAIKAAAKDPEHLAHQSAGVIMDVATARYENVDLSLPLVAAQFQALNQTGLLTEDDVDALRAMSIKVVPVTEYEVRCVCQNSQGEWLV